jgi:hypothetical protein
MQAANLLVVISDQKQEKKSTYKPCMGYLSTIPEYPHEVFCVGRRGRRKDQPVASSMMSVDNSQRSQVILGE